MGWLDSFLDPGEGYSKGQEQLDKYYNEAKQYYTDAQGNLKPYNEFGKDAYIDYSGAMKKLLDPAALEAEWTKGYSESPSAKNAEAMAQEHGLDAASGLGLMGSNTALNAIQGGTTNIGLNDRSNYLNNLMQKYLYGTNIAGNIFGTGAGAAGQMSNNAMNMGKTATDMGNNSAQMAYGEQNAGGALMSSLLGAGIGAAGTALGGPMGGMLASHFLGGGGGSGGMPSYAKNAIMGGGGWSLGGA